MASKLKEALAVQWCREKAYDDILGEALASMFVRRGLPEDFDETGDLIEYILLTQGIGAYVKRDDGKDDRWIFGACQLAGEPDSYGFGRNAIVTAGDGFVREYPDWRTAPDIVVAFNTGIVTPDYNVGRFADMLEKTETSMICQLMNSRHHPLPIVNDEKMRVAVDTAIADMEAGVNRTVVSANLFKDLFELGIDKAPFDVLSISDPSMSDHIQYLSHFKDDLLRWFWNMYGHNSEATAKMAQQSVAEATSGASISMIIPHARYHARQREAVELKKKFGWDVTIEFSEPWQNSFARCEEELMEAAPEEEVNDADPDDMEEAGVPADEDRGESDDV